MFGESGIRLASIIIGVLFIIGFVVLANRFGGSLRQKLQSTKVAQVTITPTPSPQTFGQIIGQTKEETYKVSNVSQIPDTGSETFIIPALFLLFGIGLKLRKA